MNWALLKRGQITVFILLLGLLGLTIGMSAASRSLSDLRQATYVESGTKALGGAEAGLQYTLSQLNNGTITPPASGCNPAFVSVRDSVAQNLPAFRDQFRDISYKICAVNSQFYSQAVGVDDVMEIDVSNFNFTTITGFRIAWNNDENAAVEVSYLDNNFFTQRYAVNGLAATGSNFSTSNSHISPVSLCGPAGGRYVDIAAAAGKLLRIRPLFASTTINVCGLSGANVTALSNSYYTIEARAETMDGAVKRVQTQKISKGLPAALDFVLFSGGNIVH